MLSKIAIILINLNFLTSQLNALTLNQLKLNRSLNGQIDSIESLNNLLKIQQNIFNDIKLTQKELHTSSLFSKDLNFVIHWALNNCPIERIKYVISSIKTFNILNKNADLIANLDEAKLISLISQVRKIWPKIDSMKFDIEIKNPTKNESRFNNLNRMLFLEFDNKVQEIIFPQGSMIPTANPIVEWAENVIPNFELSSIGINKDLENKNFKKIFLHFLRTSYKVDDLKDYLKKSWDYILKNIKNVGDDPILTNNYCQTLAIDMCFPVRKSVPIATKVISTTKKHPMKEIYLTKNMKKFFNGFLCKKCSSLLKKELAINVDATTEYCGCSMHQKEICQNFWPNLTEKYILSFKLKIDHKVKSTLEMNGRNELIQSFHNLSPHLCPF